MQNKILSHIFVVIITTTILQCVFISTPVVFANQIIPKGQLPSSENSTIEGIERINRSNPAGASPINIGNHDQQTPTSKKTPTPKETPINDNFGCVGDGGVFDFGYQLCS